MHAGLVAIRQELKRLQSEGVDRVYVGDATLQLLAGARSSAAPARPTPTVVPEIIKPAAVAKAVEAAPVSAFPPPPEFDLPEDGPAGQMQWLRQTVLDCPVCREHLGASGKVVFGEGNEQADLFFCGEAPGEEEARSGRPFVGKAGQLLDKILSAMGLSREKVYMADILKWQPGHDKPIGTPPPTVEEIAFCLPYLKAQIRIVCPKVVIALGNTAVSGLLGPDPDRRMSSIRGTWQEFDGIPLMATFHPSYLLRRDDSSTKRQVWEDMMQVMEKTGLSISEKQRSYFLPK